MADFNKRQTAATIVQNVCALMGLPVPSVVASNPADVTAQQLWALLRFEGRRLCKPTAGNRWQVLNRVWTLPTTAGKTIYALPPDWDSFIDITGWNSTSRLPMIGPANPMQWQALKARTLGSTMNIIYRTSGGAFEIYSAPATSQTLSIAYTSRGWIFVPASNTYKDFNEFDDDVVMFDPELMTLALKLAWMTQKGFDTQAAQGEYNEMLEAALNADSDAPALVTDGAAGYPYLNATFNTPDTGYGM